MENKLRYLLLLIGLLSTSLYGQQIKVNGTVSDANSGEPLIGVTIYALKMETGTVTDYEGAFELLVSIGDTLAFSYTGYTSIQRLVENTAPMQIQLRVANTVLDEVVVIGYGTKQRSDLTGAIASVSTEDIEKKPFARLENALQGSVAGVQVNQYSGKPGNTISVRIRGATSLSAGNEPLYVVDDVPVLSTEGIDPSNIASIEVMKDASASAIYGARAANGVVLITTKRGRPNQSEITLNTSVGVSQVNRTLPVLGTTDYVDLINETYVNAGQAPVLSADNFTANTDWQEEIFRDALTSNLQLSVSGGKATTRYYIAAGRTAQEGVVRDSDFERFNFRTNFDAELRPGIKVGTNLSVSRVGFNNVPDNNRVNQGGVILGALSTPPIIGIYNPDGTYTSNPLQAWENPVANVEAPEDVATTTRVIGNLFADFEVLPKLRFRSSLGLETYYNKNDYFLDPFRTQFGRSLEGIGTTSTNRELIWLWENTLNYDWTRGENDFNFLVGVTAQESGYEGTFARAEGFPNGAITTLNAGSRKIEASFFAFQWALFSYLSRVSFSRQGKYLADLSFRADGSSRFGRGNRFAYFPAASVAWRVSQEDFFNTKRIDDLKMRASIGATGNQNIGDFTALGLYATGSNYNFNDIILPGTRPATISNENLKWETTAQYNIGLDVSLFNYKLNFTADYYRKLTSDLLINVDLPRSTGFASGIQNLGEVLNQGWEFSLRSYNVQRNKFSWETQFNISANRNEVLDIGGPDQVIFAGDIPERGFSVIVREGLPLGSFYGYESLGVSPETGNIVFADLNEDGQIDDNDRTVIGDANPDFILGLTNTLSWGGFSLDILLQASVGNDVFNASRIETEGMFSVKNARAEVLDRWRAPGDISRIPRAIFGDPDQNSRISSRFIEDGSYLRLRNVTLSYALPKAVLERFRLSNFSLYLSGQNLLTLTAYSGYDPEVNRDGGNVISQGIDYGTYPQARIVTTGLQLAF